MIQETKNILQDLEPGGRTVKTLAHDGFLFLEHDVPYIMVYRRSEVDGDAILRLVRTGASYLLIGDENLEYFKDFLSVLTKKMADRFGSFLLIELYSGKINSSEFIVKGPTHKLPASLKVLVNELEAVNGKSYNNPLNAKLLKTKQRQKPEQESIFRVEELKELGGILLGIEVPPVYKDASGRFFPVYFKKFQKQFAKALQRSIYEFTRMQTSSKIASYHALGRRQIHKEVLKIDQQITEIQNSYSFLLLVAPTNIQEIRQRYFESDFKDLSTYHYRLLPVNPDLLKRKLYNLDIHKIDDPALAYIYDEKREEIDNELTMLKERGTKNFFYSSIRLYKNVSEELLAEAKLILNKVPEADREPEGELMQVDEFKALAQKEFDYFKETASDFKSKIHVREDVNIMMVSDGELYLPADYKLSQTEAKALIQHEIGTHVLTNFNGKKQPLSQLAHGLAGYDALQEGIAVMAEYLAGALGPNRLRTLAGRVLAGSLLINGADFHTIFYELHRGYGFAKERAFDITSRIYQGGGLIKDVVYLRGLLQLRDHLTSGGELEPLLAGKFALRHLDIIEDLTKRGLLQQPILKPRYLQEGTFKHKLEEFTKGMPLYKMV